MRGEIAKTAILGYSSIIILVFILAAGTAVSFVIPLATVSPATGGESIPADTTGISYTALTGPEIDETSAGQIGTGTIIIEFPAGFEIDTSASVAVIVNSPDDAASNINGVPSGTELPVQVIDSRHISFNVDSQSTGSGNGLLFVNIGVRPTQGTPLAYGNIILDEDSESEITGVDRGYTLGTLTEVTGTVTSLLISPKTATINQGASRSYSSTGRDIFGNPAGVLSSTTLFGIDIAAGGSFSANTYTSEKAGIWTILGAYGAVTDTATLTVLDITPPAISMIGSDVTIEVHTPYVDDGATALDDTDGDLTGSIMTVNTVNSDVLGTYTVTYSVSDAAGNNAVAVRNVNVVDTTAPVITVTGANPIAVHYGDTYTDEGATASDNYDGDLTGSIITVNPVNTNVLGIQTVTYDVTDSSGNTAHAERTVNVIDEVIPIITMLGTSPVDVPVNTLYVDAGATALDNADGDITDDIATNSNVDASALGNYSVTYDVSDSSGNAAVTVTRIVRVVDITPPVISVLGDSPIYVERTTAYADAGATAMDDVDGDLTSAIVTNNPVNSNIDNTYTVTYDVSDGSGNAAHAERTVYVQDTTPPELMSAVTQDSDNDGMIDSIVLTFSENIGDEYLDAGNPDNWDVEGYENESIGTGANEDDDVLVLAFSESDSSDTGATPSISYTQSGNPTSTHDLAGNELADITTTATDGARPILTLNGDNPMTITVGGTFTDPGANATEPGTITATGDVNTSVAGTYTITYSMTDSAGNEAANVTRTVRVVTPFVPTGGGGGGGGGTHGPASPRNPNPPAPSAGQQPITLPQLPLVTGRPTPPQNNPLPPTGNNQPVTPPPMQAPNDLPIMPQATGIFNLNTRMKWFGIGALLLLLLALGTYAYSRMKRNTKPQFYP